MLILLVKTLLKLVLNNHINDTRKQKGEETIIGTPYAQQQERMTEPLKYQWRRQKANQLAEHFT